MIKVGRNQDSSSSVASSLDENNIIIQPDPYAELEGQHLDIDLWATVSYVENFLN